MLITLHIQSAKSMGYEEVEIITQDTCDICKSKTKLNTDSIDLPPYHANCKCKLSITKTEEK